MPPSGIPDPDRIGQLFFLDKGLVSINASNPNWPLCESSQTSMTWHLVSGQKLLSFAHGISDFENIAFATNRFLFRLRPTTYGPAVSMRH